MLVGHCPESKSRCLVADVRDRLLLAEKSLKRSMARPDETSLAFYPGRLNAVRSIAAC